MGEVGLKTGEEDFQRKAVNDHISCNINLCNGCEDPKIFKTESLEVLPDILTKLLSPKVLAVCEDKDIQHDTSFVSVLEKQEDNCTTQTSLSIDLPPHQQQDNGTVQTLLSIDLPPHQQQDNGMAQTLLSIDLPHYQQQDNSTVQTLLSIDLPHYQQQDNSTVQTLLSIDLPHHQQQDNGTVQTLLSIDLPPHQQQDNGTVQTLQSIDLPHNQQQDNGTVQTLLSIDLPTHQQQDNGTVQTLLSIDLPHYQQQDNSTVQTLLSIDLPPHQQQDNGTVQTLLSIDLPHHQQQDNGTAHTLLSIDHPPHHHSQVNKCKMLKKEMESGGSIMPSIRGLCKGIHRQRSPKVRLGECSLVQGSSKERHKKGFSYTRTESEGECIRITQSQETSTEKDEPNKSVPSLTVASEKGQNKEGQSTALSRVGRTKGFPRQVLPESWSDRNGIHNPVVSAGGLDNIFHSQMCSGEEGHNESSQGKDPSEERVHNNAFQGQETLKKEEEEEEEDGEGEDVGDNDLQSTVSSSEAARNKGRQCLGSSGGGRTMSTVSSVDESGTSTVSSGAGCVTTTYW